MKIKYCWNMSNNYEEGFENVCIVDVAEGDCHYPINHLFNVMEKTVNLNPSKSCITINDFLFTEVSNESEYDCICIVQVSWVDKN